MLPGQWVKKYQKPLAYRATTLHELDRNNGWSVVVAFSLAGWWL